MAYYFAYDLDMDVNRVQARCPGAKFVRKAKLPYYKPEFVEYPGAKPIIDLVPDEKKEIWGALYFVQDIDVAQLDLGMDKNRTRRLLPVWDSDNRTYAAYVYATDLEGNIVPPDKDYHEKILNLSRMVEVPDKYYDALKAIKPK